MRMFVTAFGIFLAVALAPLGAFATSYVDTSGQIIKEEDLGIYCRPTEELSDGRLMVYSTSEAYVKLLKMRMIDRGVTDEPTLRRWEKMAQLNDCTKRAGLNCSAGTCKSGSCETETDSKGFKACKCK